jgi:hypothetical protein
MITVSLTCETTRTKLIGFAKENRVPHRVGTQTITFEYLDDSDVIKDKKGCRLHFSLFRHFPISIDTDISIQDIHGRTIYEHV